MPNALNNLCEILTSLLLFLVAFYKFSLDLHFRKIFGDFLYILFDFAFYQNKFVYQS